MSDPDRQDRKPFDKRGFLFAVISIGGATISVVTLDLATFLVPIAVLFCFAGLWRVIRGYPGANAPMAIIAAAVTAAVVYSSFQELEGAILNGKCTDVPGAEGGEGRC